MQKILGQWSPFSRRTLGGLTLPALVLIAGACGQREAADSARDSPTGTTPAQVDTTTDAVDTTSQNIYDVLRDGDRFSMFVAAIDAAGLSQTLSGPGPYTVFAPTNEAFTQMEANFQDLLSAENEDRLLDVLLHHVSNGETMASNLHAASIRSLSGEDLHVDGSAEHPTVNGARVIESDVDASNGVVHVLDRVLLLDAEEADGM